MDERVLLKEESKERMMKKILGILGALALSPQVRADIVFSDSFTYPDGNLVGAPGSPWIAHSSPGIGPVVVVSGAIDVSRSNSEDVSVTLPGGPFASKGSIPDLYVAFSIRFTTLPSAAGSYFAHWNTTSNVRCRFWASTANAASGKFRLGIGNSTSADANSGQLATDLSLKTNYTVVVRYELATGLSTLWIDPASETDPGVTATDSPGTSLPAIAAFSFRQAGGIGIMSIDNLIIGTTFTDVVGGNLPPSVTAIAIQSIPAGGSTGAIPFTVGDDHTPAADLLVTARSDNQTLVPDDHVTIGGNGQNRTVTVTPAPGQQGRANISISVGDGSASSEASFLVRVGAPSIAAIANQISPINSVLGPLTVIVADAEEGPGALTVGAVSSNPLLVTDANIEVGGSGANRTLSIVPENSQTGLTTITVSADDGHQTSVVSFVLTVHPVFGLMFSDDFNRPDGSLVDGVSPWISHSGLFGETRIVQNRLSLSQNQTEDVSHWLDDPGTLYSVEGGHVFFASFVVNFSALPAGTGTYFAHFKDDAISYRARVFATTVGAPLGSVQLGITSASSDVTAARLHPAVLNLNTDHLVVIRLNAATGESRLWIDPTSQSRGYVDSTDTPFPSVIQAFAFRQAGPANGMGVLTVDDVKVGTAFTDVADNLPVPLDFTRNNHGLRLSWPTGRGFILQHSPSLPATVWSEVSFTTEGTDDVADFDISTGAGFFRLERSN